MHVCLSVCLCVYVHACVCLCVYILTWAEQDDGGDDEEADDEDDQQGDDDALPVPLGRGAAHQVLPSKYTINTHRQHTASDWRQTNAHKPC